MDALALHRQMARAREVELALADLWRRGLVSGELHLGTGEEAVAAGIVAHLREGDGLALDYRSTPPLVVRGVPLVPLLREMLGREDGLCAGRGGHMHLFSREHLAASSGIVGATAPLGAGFALAARLLRPGAAAVSFLGEGATNQGMALEALNLAVVWRLPLVFVCKDNRWSFTTRSPSTTAGDVRERAAAFGMPAERVDGLDVEAVWEAGGAAIERARGGGGPTFLLAACVHLDGHLAGDPLLATARRPAAEGRGMLRKVAAAAVKPAGGGLAARRASMRDLRGMLSEVRESADPAADPLALSRSALAGHGEELRRIEEEVAAEVAAAVAAALDGDRGEEG